MSEQQAKYVTDAKENTPKCSICGDDVKIDAHGRATCFTCGKFVTAKKPPTENATQPKLFTLRVINE